MKEQRNKEQEIKFIENVREFYYSKKEEIFELIEKEEKESYLEPGFSGWTSNLYISENDYSLCSNMSQGQTTMDNYENRELFVLGISSRQDINDICEDSLENLKIAGYEIGIDLDENIEKYKNEYISEKKEFDEDFEEDDIEFYELEEYIKEKLETNDSDDFEKIKEEYVNSAIAWAWDSAKEFYENKIDEQFEMELANANQIEDLD